MGKLTAIQGGKTEARAKALAAARIIECACGSRTLIETRTGVAVDRHNRVVHRGTLMRKCAFCGKLVE